MVRFDHYVHLAGAQVLEELLADVEVLRNKLDRLNKGQETLMGDTSKLSSAVSDLKAEVAAVASAITAGAGADQAAIDQAVADIAAAVGVLKAAVPPAVVPPTTTPPTP